MTEASDCDMDISTNKRDLIRRNEELISANLHLFRSRDKFKRVVEMFSKKEVDSLLEDEEELELLLSYCRDVMSEWAKERKVIIREVDEK